MSGAGLPVCAYACSSTSVWHTNIQLLVFVATVNVYVPKDRVTNLHQGYGFVEFRSEEDADYVSIYLYVTYFMFGFTHIELARCLHMQELELQQFLLTIFELGCRL